MSYSSPNDFERHFTENSSPYFEDIDQVNFLEFKEFLVNSQYRITEEFSLQDNDIHSSHRLNDNKEKTLVISSNEQASFICKPQEENVITSFDCGTCPKKFSNKEAFDRHTITHMRNVIFKCPYKGCDKIYKSKENMTLHFKNIHLNDKPYKCKFCSSLFSHRNGKTYHERKFHTNIMPYVCDLDGCTMAFASKSSLTYHKNNQHNSNGTLKITRRKNKKSSEINVVNSTIGDLNKSINVPHYSGY